MNATVYLNGKQLGTHPNGYAPFAFTLPGEELRYGNEENVLAVKVDHKQPSSRWYSGSGIYRDVTLTVTDPVHVAYHGTTVTTPDIENGTGTVQVAADIENNSAAEASVSVRQVVYEAGGKEPVATGDTTQAQVIAAGQKAKITGTATVASPKLWTTDTPNLYTVRTEVYVGNTLTDAYEFDFGFRWATFTKDNGFFLNGKNIKLRGVCMHHDQGGLGSEAWYRSVERQVEKLKEMGANTIRVTHNPASSALIDICNRKGMMLVEEAFDAWLSDKAGNTEGVGSAKAAKTETPTGGYQNYTSGTGCFDSGKASGHTSLYATFSVKYEEGRLEAKAFEADGVTEITDTDGRSFVETAQAASKLNIKADRKEITADGTDLSYLTIDVTDADGRFVNGAEPEVTVSVEGAGKLLALDNGVQNDVTSHSEPTRKAGKGKL